MGNNTLKIYDLRSCGAIQNYYHLFFFLPQIYKLEWGNYCKMRLIFNINVLNPCEWKQRVTRLSSMIQSPAINFHLQKNAFTPYKAIYPALPHMIYRHFQGLNVAKGVREG